MKQKQICQKPISSDVHFKYRCPSPTCSYEHWLSLTETQTKNFKIVCDCGTVFKPKRIKTIQIIYSKNRLRSNKPVEIKLSENIQDPAKLSIDKDLLYKARDIMIGFGFTEQEAISMIQTYYSINPDNNILTLVKNTISHHSNLEKNNV
jgi:hypothetical protein